MRSLESTEAARVSSGQQQFAHSIEIIILHYIRRRPPQLWSAANRGKPASSLTQSRTDVTGQSLLNYLSRCCDLAVLPRLAAYGLHPHRHPRINVRGVAQSGSAPGSGPGGRRFESSRPDHSSKFGSFEDHIEGLSICRRDTYGVHGAVRKQHSEQFGLFDRILRNISSPGFR